jgi:hypothetical protein
MTEQEELQRAEQAKQILRNPLVREALDGIKSGIIENWRQAPVKDTDLREKLWSIYAGACKFEELLQSHIETGKLAQASLNERNTPRGGRPR